MFFKMVNSVASFAIKMAKDAYKSAEQSFLKDVGQTIKENAENSVSQLAESIKEEAPRAVYNAAQTALEVGCKVASASAKVAKDVMVEVVEVALNAHPASAAIVKLAKANNLDPIEKFVKPAINNAAEIGVKVVSNFALHQVNEGVKALQSQDAKEMGVVSKLALNAGIAIQQMQIEKNLAPQKALNDKMDKYFVDNFLTFAEEGETTLVISPNFEPTKEFFIDLAGLDQALQETF